MRFHFVMLLIVILVSLGMHSMASAAARSHAVAGQPALAAAACADHRAC